MIYSHLATDWLDAARARECTQHSRFLQKIIEILLKNRHTMIRNLLFLSYSQMHDANALSCVHDPEKRYAVSTREAYLLQNRKRK